MGIAGMKERRLAVIIVADVQQNGTYKQSIPAQLNDTTIKTIVPGTETKLPGEEMGNKRGLTDKQNNFCLNLVQGLSQRDAYIKAGYSDNQLPEVIDNHAYELAKRGDIKVRCEELRQVKTDNTIATKEQVLKRLSDITLEDIESHRGVPIRSSNIQAAEVIAKLQGWYTPEEHTIELKRSFIFILPDGTEMKLGEENIQRSRITEGSQPDSIPEETG